MERFLKERRTPAIANFRNDLFPHLLKANCDLNGVHFHAMAPQCDGRKLGPSLSLRRMASGGALDTKWTERRALVVA
jgi:hypothetical protein